VRILVCGSRAYTNAAKIRSVLAEIEYRSQGPTIVHGAAIGADHLAAEAAFLLGYRTEAYPADWEKHGRAAGPIRNRQMLDTKPDLVIAFGHGKGTSDTVTEARHRGIPVRRES
jgi:hypothetical protein